MAEAVSFAVRVQAVMAKRNAALADDGKMPLRIGINLGDVLVDGGAPGQRFRLTGRVSVCRCGNQDRKCLGFSGCGR